MKIAAIVCLAAGIVAAAAGIVSQALKIRRTGKAGRGVVGSIVFASVYIVIAVVNLIFVIPNL